MTPTPRRRQQPRRALRVHSLCVRLTRLAAWAENSHPSPEASNNQGGMCAQCVSSLQGLGACGVLSTRPFYSSPSLHHSHTIVCLAKGISYHQQDKVSSL